MSTDTQGPNNESIYAELKPACNTIKLFLYIMIIVCSLHIIMRLVLLKSLSAGESQGELDIIWIFIGTTTDDVHSLIGFVLLAILGVWLKKARRNVKALQLKGAFSPDDIYGTIILLPHYFLSQYEEVVADLWRLCSMRSQWSDKRSRPSNILPKIWWLSLVVIGVFHGIYYDLSARYFQQGFIEGQIYVSWIAVVLFTTVILSCLFTKYIITSITLGQSKLNTLSKDYRETFDLPADRKPHVFFGILVVIFSSITIFYFTEILAPEIPS